MQNKFPNKKKSVKKNDKAGMLTQKSKIQMVNSYLKGAKKFNRRNAFFKIFFSIFIIVDYFKIIIINELRTLMQCR